MTNSKIRIEFQDSVLEVEGSETFVTKIYDDFKALFLNNETSKKIITKTNNEQTIKKQTIKKERTDRKYNKLNDLSLDGSNESPSLKEFYDEINPSSHLERVLCFIYF